ncbi:MAG: type II secretion system secretin GspD [Usitatibacter sp.]
MAVLSPIKSLECLLERWIPAAPATFLAACLLLASCAALPPGMRGKEAPPTVPPATSAQADFGPLAPKTPPPAPAPANPPAVAKVFSGNGTFVNPKPPAPPPAPGPEEASLNFEGLDVREVAKVILGDYLKLSYTVHPNVTGTVTFRTVRPIPMKDLLPTLEMLLRQNNAAVVNEEGIYKILPVTAVRGSVSPQLGGSTLPIPAGYSVLVVPLKYVGALEMQRLLVPFAADNTIIPDTVRNLVVLAGNERELKHLLDTIDLFDVDWLAGYSVGLFPVKSADVKTLSQDLDHVFGPAGQSPLSGIVRVIPIERMNALLIVTTQPRYLELARSWLDRLDQSGGGSGGTRFYVYPVRNGKAENLAQLVGDLFSSRRTTTTAPSLAPGQRPTEIRSAPFGQPQPSPQTTTTSVTPAATTFQIPGGVGGTTSSEVRVIADKDTNSLLILATPSDYDVIENALRKLDTVRRQVLVEVLLAEVSLTDELAFGIDWFINTHWRGNPTTGQLNFGGLPPTNAPPSATNIVPFPASGGLQLINLTSNQIRAVLNTFGTNGKTRVLAAPQIMVLDNEKAEIKVGDRISVQTQSQTGVSTGTGVINSFQYLETGILLAVTPRINSGGMVTLEINQEVSQPKASQFSGSGGNPDVSTRNAKTSVVVANGESMVMAGLIRETSTMSSSGLPLLSKIPVVGALFGHQDLTKDRTELVLMITPRIVSDTGQAREVTDELRKKLPSLESLLPKPPTTPPPPMTELLSK